MKISYLLLFAPLICLLLMTEEPAQLYSSPQEAVQLQKPLEYRVSVTLKLIQVYVTDKKGNAVLDLNKNNFILNDNGKPQNLTEFEKHFISFPSAKKGQEIITTQTTLVPAPREFLNRRFFLFFDFAYSSPKGVLKAKEAALHFINTRLQPSDEVGVISYSAIKGLKLHEFLTTEHKKVQEVIEQFGLRDASGRAEDLEAKYQRERQFGGFADATEDQQQLRLTIRKQQIEPSANASDDKYFASNYIKMLSGLAEALRYVQGQKYLVLFSGGIPGTAIYGNLSIDRLIPEDKANLSGLAGDAVLRNPYEDMCRELSTSNITVYVLNSDQPTAASGRGTGAYPLRQMANATGGKYFGNINSYEQHFEKVQNLTGSYYVLGFYIDEKWDGKYHKIKVRVNRPGCEVVAQGGYFNPKPFLEYSDLEKKLHLIDLALADTPLYQTPVRFPMMAMACSTEKEGNLCLAARIPVKKVQDISGKRVEIIDLVFDAADNIAELRRTEEDFSKVSNENAYYYAFLTVPSGAYRCRVVIRNLETGMGAVGASTVIIPAQKEKGIQLFPFLLLTPERSALYIKGFIPKNLVGKTGAFSLSDSFFFDARQYSPYLDKTLAQNSELWSVFRCSVRNIPSPELHFSAQLKEKSSGQEILLPLTMIEQKREKDETLYFIKFLIPELHPGEYLFSLIGEERTSSSKSQVATDYIIK
jgi:VWFA-related protein